MSFRMDVKVEKILEDGAYDAKLANLEQKETKFGDRLMWTFEVDGERRRGCRIHQHEPLNEGQGLPVGGGDRGRD